MTLDLKKLETEIDSFLDTETEQSLNNLFKIIDNNMNTDKVMIHGIEYVPKLVPEPAKVGRWMPETGKAYWTILGSGEIAYVFWNCQHSLHENRFRMGNMYQTEELATRARDKQLLIVELQDYADEKNAGEELPINCYSLVKSTNKWVSNHCSNIKPRMVLFRTRDDAQSAIEHFGSRLDLLL